jgi:hypothetical protein
MDPRQSGNDSNPQNGERDERYDSAMSHLRSSLSFLSRDVM